MATVWCEDEKDEAIVEVIMVGEKAIKLSTKDGDFILIILTDEEKKLILENYFQVTIVSPL